MRKQFIVIGVLLLLFGATGVTALIKNQNQINTSPNGKVTSFDTITLYPTDDVHIRQNYPDNNEGSAPDMNIRNDGGINYAWQGLIRFDLSSVQIPDDTPIRATLNCYYRAYADVNPTGRAFNLFRITEEWNEEIATWNTQPSCAPQISTIGYVPDTPGTWMKWDVTQDVTTFLNGAIQNYGWKISDDAYWGYYDIPITRFSTKEGISQPYLQIHPLIFNKAVLIGRITNVDTSSDTQITFNAQFVRYIQFSPFSFQRYSLGEQLTISKPYQGILTLRFAFGVFNVAI
jgi:hypothetical protein